MFVPGCEHKCSRLNHLVKFSLPNILLILFQANNLVIWSAVKEYNNNQAEGKNEDGYNKRSKPHIVTSNLEHDSIKLVLENLETESCAGKFSGMDAEVYIEFLITIVIDHLNK